MRYDVILMINGSWFQPLSFVCYMLARHVSGHISLRFSKPQSFSTVYSWHIGAHKNLSFEDYTEC